MTYFVAFTGGIIIDNVKDIDEARKKAEILLTKMDPDNTTNLEVTDVETVDQEEEEITVS